MERLGVGSKMVKSIRYWLQATGLSEERYINSGRARAQYLTEDFGKVVQKWDPYFDDIFTLFLLHYHIVSNQNLCMPWSIFFNEYDGQDFTKENMIEVCKDLLDRKMDEGSSFSENSFSDDCSSIDIGGFTVDVLKLRRGKPDLEVMESFEQGVITLYNSIISQCNSQFDRLLEDSDIDEAIRGEPTILPGEIQMLIRTAANQFLNEFYNFLRERGIDVKSSKCVFAGGGSILLRNLIERSGKVGYPIFIDNIHANAIGYELLYRSEVTANGSK